MLLHIALVFDYTVAEGSFQSDWKMGHLPFRTSNRFGFGMLAQVAFLGESSSTGKGSESNGESIENFTYQLARPHWPLHT